MKSVRIRRYSGPYFPAFGLNTEKTNEVRLDIKARRVWERGQEAFLDLRVFDPNACRYLNKSLQ